MPAVRTKRQFMMADIAKSRAKARLKNRGLAPDLIDINAFENAINNNDSPDIEMIDEEIDRLLAKALEVSCWATMPTSSSASSNISVHTPTPTDQIKSTPTPPCPARSIDSPTSEETLVIDLSTSQENSRTPPNNTTKNISDTTMRKPPCPPELQEVVKAEERHAAQMAANLEVCTAEIYGVEDALAHLSTGMVRLHGKTRAGAPYRSWLAHFTRDQAPRPGFRLFDESGIAVVFKPRQPIQQFKRCFGFHVTRSCPRAPSCENCSSTMHLVTNCKALTRCRNCEGPQRSDSRNCLARPSRSEQVTKDQLKTIRQMSQREHHAEARTKAAIIRAEAAAINKEKPSTDPNSNQDVISTDEVNMSEASVVVGTSSQVQL